MTAYVEQELARLGLELPPPLQPNASYVPVTRHGNVLYVSGQLAFDNAGSLPVTGRLGASVDVDCGRECAQRCALHLLAQLNAAVGDLGLITKILKLHVYVASTPEFAEHHLVANGASDLLCDLLGSAGPHARSAFGVANLPFDSPVEVDAIVAVA
jgi:enamine deaminase RidA (YjgF/YER057c/UK114 family)